MVFYQGENHGTSHTGKDPSKWQSLRCLSVFTHLGTHSPPSPVLPAYSAYTTEDLPTVRERAELKLGFSKDSQLIPLSRRTPRDITVGKKVENRLDTEDLEQRELFTDSRGISHRKRRWLSLSENESVSPVMGSDGT